VVLSLKGGVRSLSNAVSVGLFILDGLRLKSNCALIEKASPVLFEPLTDLTDKINQILGGDVKDTVKEESLLTLPFNWESQTVKVHFLCGCV